MTKLPFDPDLVFAVLMEMADRSQLLLKLIPKDLDESRILKHLAASQIHLTYFATDVDNLIKGKEKEKSYHLEKFLELCGCNFNEDFKPTKKEER